MTAEIIQLSSHVMTESPAVAGETQSIQDLRARAWRNFYQAERDDGAEPALAFQRANYFITKRFDGLIDDIRSVTERG